MRFTIEQQFDVPAEQVIAAFADPDLYPSLQGLTKVDTPEVLSARADGDHVHLQLRMRFIADLSAAARAVIDPAKLSWVQDEHYDLDQLTATIRFLPDNYADRFSCTGTHRFVAASVSPPASSLMRTQGDLKVRAPLVGGQVERALVSGLDEHFAEMQPLVAAWMSR
jgi:hypothetical protein